MNICVYNYYEIFNNKNELFGEKHYTLGEDISYWLMILKNRLEAAGHFVGTIDLKPVEEFGVFIFLDLPKNMDLVRNNKKRGVLQYLVTLESEIIRPQNFFVSNEELFDKIFTWKPHEKGKNKYIVTPIPRNIAISEENYSNLNRRLCTMVFSKKRHWDARELYSERARLISCAIKREFKDFDLWGYRWDEGICFVDTLRFNGHKRLFKILAKAYRYFPKKSIPFYMGTTDNKLKTLGNYRFAVCFENAAHIDGYITEKIFDCMRVGTIPIYWGADDILDFIPRECFIDMREFASYEDLFERLLTLDETAVEKMRSSIRVFLKSETARSFSAEHFVGLLERAIEQDQARLTKKVDA